MKDKYYILKIMLIGLITGFCNGLFGAGGGMIAVPSMIHILHMDEHEAHATAIAVILPLVIVSLFVYFRHGFLDFSKAIPVAIGGIIGGISGAFLLKRIPSVWLKKIFALFMIAAAIRMVLK
ncbi:MAG: sulfite exporter TauE/SafE family protein [Caldicoprobacterales bacterium]